jgi:hypothetical protein
MKIILISSLGMVLFCCGLILAVGYTESHTVEVRYDCRMLIGGWHPDFPARVIEDCRNKNKGK